MVSDRSVNLPAGREEAAISAGQGHEDVPRGTLEID